MGKTLGPARPVPATGLELGSCSSGGYSTVMESSVRAPEPATEAVSSSAGFLLVALCALCPLLLSGWRVAGAVWNPEATAVVTSRARSRLGVVGPRAGRMPRIRAAGVRCAAARSSRPAGSDIAANRVLGCLGRGREVESCASVPFNLLWTIPPRGRGMDGRPWLLYYTIDAGT